MSDIQIPEPSLSRPSVFANLEHYFSWCATLESFYRDRVNRNPKTARVNLKLQEWHDANPDLAVSNVVKLRFDRLRRGVA
mgnify:FL=1